MIKEKFQQLKEKLNSSENILITLSDPDGDSVGSSLALFNELKLLKKNVSIISSFEIPDYLKFLPLLNELQIHDLGTVDFSKYDIVILVDSSNASRSVEFAKYPNGWSYPENTFVVCFDHHSSHDGDFASIDVFDKSVSSTCELVYEFFKYLNVKIQKDTATLLFTGMYTDSGGFYFENTGPQTMIDAGELLSIGAQKDLILSSLNRPNSWNTFKVIAAAINNTEIIKEENFSYLLSKLRKSDYQNFQTQDMEEAVSILKGRSGFLQNTKDTDFGVIISEREKTVEVSFRTRYLKYDLSVICKNLGGGGHPKACGFSSTKNFDEVVEMVEKEIKGVLGNE